MQNHIDEEDFGLLTEMLSCEHLVRDDFKVTFVSNGIDYGTQVVYVNMEQKQSRSAFGHFDHLLTLIFMDTIDNYNFLQKLHSKMEQNQLVIVEQYHNDEMLVRETFRLSSLMYYRKGLHAKANEPQTSRFMWRAIPVCTQ